MYGVSIRQILCLQPEVEGRCTIAKLVPREHNIWQRGTIPSMWCLI